MRTASNFNPAARLAAACICLLVVVLPARAGVDIQRVVSPGGVTAWLVEDYTVPIVSIRFSFAGGSAQDPEGKEGLANLMTGLFDEGAGDMDADAFQERLDDAGAEMGFYDGRDRLSGSMRMIADTRDEAFELLRLAVNEPRFDDAPFQRIRAQIASGIRARANDPDTIAGRRFIEALLPGHPYARQSRGTEESLAAIAPDDLHAFHRQVMARDHLVIGVVGAIDAETLKAKLDLVFGSLPAKSELAPIADTEPKLGQRVELDYDQPQTSLTLAFPGVARHDDGFFAAYLMNHVLGGGTFSSRLYDEVREKRGLAYNVGSYVINQEHTNRLVVSTATRAERAGDTLALLRKVIADYAETGPTQEELDAAKRYIKGSYAVENLDTSMSVASTLVGIQEDDLGIDYIDRREALIDAVTLDEVKAAAQRLLTVEPAVLVVGPKIEAVGASADR